MKQRSRLLAAALVVPLALAGCASTGADEASLSPAQRELRARSNQNFNETVGTGAVAGALLGAVAGALLGGKNRGQSAAIGAAAGAALGGASGYYVATQNERYATREQAVDARIQAAQKEADDYRSMAELSDRVAAENKRKLAALDQSYKSGQITAAEYRRQAKSVEADVRDLRRALEENQKVLVGISQDQSRMPGPAAANLGRSKAEIEAARRRIADNTDDLVRSLAAVPPA